MIDILGIFNFPKGIGGGPHVPNQETPHSTGVPPHPPFETEQSIKFDVCL